MRTLTERELIDFMHGANVYGTGGGGSVESAMRLLGEAMEKNLQFKLVDPAEIPDDAVVACPYGVGGGVSEEIRKRFDPLPRLPQHEIVSMAVEALEGQLDKRIYGFVLGELGAGNSFLAMYMAALTGRYIVDGDEVGRSVPEVVHATFTICNVAITPYVIVTPFGDVMLVTKVLNDSRAEDIDRFMAVASGGGATVIDHPVEGKKLRESIILNTVTKSIEVGRSLREARQRGDDPVEAVVKSTGGYILFRGNVEKFEREGREGFMWGNTYLKGSDQYQGKRYRVWFKNENLLSWLNGEPHVTCPDLICILDTKTAHALSNWGDEISKGRDVTVIGIRAPDMWRTRRGLELLTPRYFGFDIGYRPIETIV
jgi:DUF917 family protein